VVTPGANAQNTTTRTMSSTQTVTTTSEIATQASYSPPQWSTAQQTESNDEQTQVHGQMRTCSSEHVCCLTKQPHRPNKPQQRSRSLPTPPCPPLLAPLAPVVPYEPTTTSNASSRPATSSTTCPLATAQPPVPPPLYIAPAAAVLRPPFPTETPLSPVLLPSMPAPLHFNWADDAASMPTTSMQPRDLPGLRTGCTQPFGNLQCHTR
jgi:hypothetical protein